MYSKPVSHQEQGRFRKVKRSKARRMFSKTAGKTRKENFVGGMPMRGGIRL